MYKEFLKNTFFSRKIYTLLTLVLWIVLSLNIYLIVNSSFKVMSGYKSLDKLRQVKVYMGNNQATPAQANIDSSAKKYKNLIREHKLYFGGLSNCYNFPHVYHMEFKTILQRFFKGNLPKISTGYEAKSNIYLIYILSINNCFL